MLATAEAGLDIVFWSMLLRFYASRWTDSVVRFKNAACLE